MSSVIEKSKNISIFIILHKLELSHLQTTMIKVLLPQTLNLFRYFSRWIHSPSTECACQNGRLL